LQGSVRAHAQGRAAAPGAIAAFGLKAFAGRRIEHHAQNRRVVAQQGDADGELRQAVREAARAVNRIDYPDPRALQARPIVGPLLRQPAVLRKCADQGIVQQAIDLEVGGRDHLTRTFEPMGPARTEMAQR
jgi:hypothetical protein